MNEQVQLLQYILDNPENMTARLVYADWLEENGQADHAKLIRLCITVSDPELKCAQYTKPGFVSCYKNPCKRCDIIRQITELFRVVKPAYKMPSDFFVRFGSPVSLDTGPYAYVQRGFIETVRCTGAKWLQIADEVTAKHPVRIVQITARNESEVMPFYFSNVNGIPRLFIDSHHKICADAGDLTIETAPYIATRLVESYWRKIKFEYMKVI